MSLDHAKVGLLVCVFTLVGCNPWGQPHISELDIGVDTRINAIIAVPELGVGLFAAASRGNIVDKSGHRWELSNHELRDLTTDHYGHYWVCGDRGYLAYTYVDQSDIDNPDVKPTWTAVVSGSEADFHGVVATKERVVVVGENILLVGIEDDEGWQLSEPSPPVGGWGRLRAVSESDGEFLVVGLDGRALHSSADADTWTALEDIDPAVDFNRSCGSLALGDDLTHARWTATGWMSGGGGATANYVGCGGKYVLTSDRWISTLSGKGLERIYRLPWQGRAFDPFGIFVAGDGGHVALWYPAEMGEW